MPRKSSNALSVIRAKVPDVRPEPIPELDPAEARQWKIIVDVMPIDWFTPDTWPILASLCNVIVTDRKIVVELRKAKAGTAKFQSLAKLHAQYIELMTRTATKLRLTPQSRFNQHNARKATKDAAAARLGRMPWDIGGIEAA